jgi:TolA-binding protein
MSTAHARLVCLVVISAPVLAPPIARADALAAPAAAAAIKNGKRTTVDVKDVERRFTRPQAPVPAATEKGPRLRPEDLQLRRGVMQKIMAHQIQKMRALVQVTADDDPQKPDFFFRLGELYVEKQRYFFEQAHALDQKIFELPPAQRGPLQATQQRHLREEQTWMLEAVKAYIAATRYPKYERMDEVLFRLAAQLATAKKDDQARAFFQRLIKDYPTSKYIPDAYLAFAEHAFEGGEMEAALRFYEKVEQRSSASCASPRQGGWPWIARSWSSWRRRRRRTS